MPKIPETRKINASRSLKLPDGYQRFDWYMTPSDGVYLNDLSRLRVGLNSYANKGDDLLYLYTQHEVFLQDGILKQTRSGPNWEGGVVTLATCKHNMRTYDRDTWVGTWIAGLGPAKCADNTLLFTGRVARQFESNYDLGVWLEGKTAYEAKTAALNPRGDIYVPKWRLKGNERFDHNNFVAPVGHTRSTEFYNKSPGSVSEREDGKVPKWWRDIEYTVRGRRPPVFVLSPCYLFSRPTAWTSYQPRRACLRLGPRALAASLRGTA